MDIRFGPFALDLAGHQLLRDRQRVPLSPKAYQLLCVLAEERPRALSRQELHARLWPGTFVSDVNLACLVSEVRTALGECRQLVRTVHRFGYAFDAPSALGPVTPGTHIEPSLVVLVLPVAALDANQASADIAVEVTDEVITRIGAMSGFSVVSLCTATALSREPLDLPRLARERGVAFVVEASLRTDAAGLHVNVRLIEAATGNSVWSERELTTVAELPDLQAHLAASLAEAMLAASPRRAPAADRRGAGSDDPGDELGTGHA